MGDQEAMEAKSWFRWTKELEKGSDKVVWKPEEVRLDVHDNEKFNRIYTKLDHTLVIKDFRPCKWYVVWKQMVLNSDTVAASICFKGFYMRTLEHLGDWCSDVLKIMGTSQDLSSSPVVTSML